MSDIDEAMKPRGCGDYYHNACGCGSVLAAEVTRLRDRLADHEQERAPLLERVCEAQSYGAKQVLRAEAAESRASDLEARNAAQYKTIADMQDREKALEAERDDYREGARVEAKAGDEARAEVERLKADVRKPNSAVIGALQADRAALQERIKELEKSK